MMMTTSKNDSCAGMSALTCARAGFPLRSALQLAILPLVRVVLYPIWLVDT